MCTLVFFGLNRVYNSYSFGGKNISLKIRHEYLNVSTISSYIAAIAAIYSLIIMKMWQRNMFYTINGFITQDVGGLQSVILFKFGRFCSKDFSPPHIFCLTSLITIFSFIFNPKYYGFLLIDDFSWFMMRLSLIAILL